MAKRFFGAAGFEPAMAAASAGAQASRQEQQHNWHLAGRYDSPYSRYSSYGGGSSRSREPKKQKGITKRAILAMVLLVLLPPVGIALMWYKGIFELRGRILLTVLSTILLTVMFGFMMPDPVVVEAHPVAGKAMLRSPLPTDAALNALSNMEELLAGIENKPVVNTDLNEVTGMTADETAQMELAATSDPMQDVVYSVTVDAKYYHAESECRGQVNKRMLTVGQALSEGLSPCKRCDPPTGG